MAKYEICLLTLALSQSWNDEWILYCTGLSR